MQRYLTYTPLSRNAMELCIRILRVLFCIRAHSCTHLNTNFIAIVRLVYIMSGESASARGLYRVYESVCSSQPVCCCCWRCSTLADATEARVHHFPTAVSRCLLFARVRCS